MSPPEPTAVPDDRRRSPPLAALKLVRPHQWVKNLFVAAPLVFAKRLTDLDAALTAGAAVLLFCAASGAVYALNDVRDVAEDRRHPIKRRRPVAAGEIGEAAAQILAAVLALVAIGGSALIDPLLAGIIAAYLANNLLYSFGLKNLAVLDVLMISAGFLLRVYGGAVAIDVEASPWLLACTGLLAGLLGFGKRAHELILVESEEALDTRKSLAGYSRRGLTMLLFILAMSTSATYALYTQSERTVHLFGTRALIFTLPFCMVGIGRFLALALSDKRLLSPTEAMIRDPLFLANIALWGASVLAIVYVF
jgi:4-hydroxybenzoate polyprenyltransferase